MKILLMLVTFLSLISVSFSKNDDAKVKELPAGLKQQIQGQWVLSGTPDKIEPAPKKGGRIKTIKGNTWEIVQKDPKTGKVIFRHGGTFTLKEDIYIESIEFANDNTNYLIGKKSKFKLTLKDGILLNHGQGNPWTEAWRRVK